MSNRTHKLCPKCHELHPIDQYRTRQRKRKDGTTRTELRSQCLGCEGRRAEPARRAKLANMSGAPAYEDLPIDCQICGAKPGKRANDIDHDHETGEYRGVLCRSCNLAVGQLKDNKTNAEALVRYLS